MTISSAAGEVLEDLGEAREVGAGERRAAVVRLGAPIGRVEIEQRSRAVVAGEACRADLAEAWGVLRAPVGKGVGQALDDDAGAWDRRKKTPPIPTNGSA